MTAVPDHARRARIGAAFAAARDYDRHAGVQHRVARRLAARIAALALPPAPRVLELGCGTGFLTAELARQGLGGTWLVTDLAPAMVERCRSRIGDGPDRSFRALDGEHGARPGEAPLDLIVSSLTFQWFADLPTALARLGSWLAPGGQLAFTTLADGTFAEWGAAHAAHGLDAGTPPFPPAGALAAMVPSGFSGEVAVERLSEPQGSARAFLGSVKAIGAGTAAAGHRPLPPGALRRVMATFEAQGAIATYEVATCIFRKGEP